MPIALPSPLRRFITQVPLRWVLTVPFVSLTVGATTLVGYLSYQSGQRAVENLGQQLVAQTNERVTQELKISLQTPLLINRLNVGAVNQGQLDLQNISALESTLFNQLQQFKPISAILFASPQGTFRVVERYPTFYLGVADPPRPDQIRIYDLSNQGERGQLVYVEKGLDVRRDRPFYQRAVKTGKPSWNLISQYGSSKELTLDASQPVYDRGTKRLLGVFAVHIRLNYLSKFLQGLDTSRFGQIIIMDQSGVLIATSTREQLYKIKGEGLKSQFKRLKIDESDNPLTRSLGQHLRTRLGILRSLDQIQSLEFRYKGEPQYVRITPFQDQYGLNWQILTVIPKSHFMSAIRDNKIITALLCVLTLGVAIALGVFAANRLTARFAELSRASRELAAGNLDQRLPTDRAIYELNSLAQTFNQMADQLQQSFNRLKTALSASEGKFTIIFRSSPDLITLTTLAEGRYIEVNDNFFNATEYAPEEVIGQRIADLGIWDDPDVRIRFFETLEQQGSVHNFEMLLRTRTGQIKTLLVSAELIEIRGETYVLGIGRDISDRKRTEQVLQEREAMLRAIGDNLPKGFIYQCVYDSEMKSSLNYISAGIEQLLGLKPEDVLANPELTRSIGFDEDLAAATQVLQHSIAHLLPIDLQMRHRTSSGEIGWSAIRETPRRLEDGSIVWDGIEVDITDLKQAEMALQESETRFQEIARTINQLFFVRSVATGEYLYISPAYEKLWGHSLESLYQNPDSWLDSVHPEDRERMLQYVPQNSQLDQMQEEYRIIRTDGAIRWISTDILVVRDKDGTPLRLVGLVEDISDRKRLEKALRASEEQFRKAFNNAPIGISLVTPSGQFVKVNPAYCELLGYTEAELLQLTFQEITDPADLEIDVKSFQQIMAGEVRSCQLEKRYITKQGTPVPVSINTAPIRDQNGQMLYCVGHIQDRRDRLKVERMKDEFISVISHELRTPLTSIRGALGILGTGVLSDRPEKAQQMLQIAINNSDRLVRLVDDILKLERLEFGKVQLIMEQCSATDLMQQAINSVQGCADQAGITLSLTPLSATLSAAPDAIIQTITNLLSNAVKFSSVGDTVWLKAEIWAGQSGVGQSGVGQSGAGQSGIENTALGSANFSSRSLQLPSPCILFTVKDQGRGIPQDKLELIFEQFQQVDVSDSHIKGGTGLGLAICKKIVQQHGGQIWAESNWGEGSTFYFALPLTKEDEINSHERS